MINSIVGRKLNVVWLFGDAKLLRMNIVNKGLTVINDVSRQFSTCLQLDIVDAILNGQCNAMVYVVNLISIALNRLIPTNWLLFQDFYFVEVPRFRTVIGCAQGNF